MQGGITIYCMLAYLWCCTETGTSSTCRQNGSASQKKLMPRRRGTIRCWWRTFIAPEIRNIPPTSGRTWRTNKKKITQVLSCVGKCWHIFIGSLIGRGEGGGGGYHPGDLCSKTGDPVMDMLQWNHPDVRYLPIVSMDVFHRSIYINTSQWTPWPGRRRDS